MLNYKKGNLLDFTEDAVGHGCNCMCVMGAGVAKAIKQRFPEMYEKDLQTRGIPEEKKLGTITYGRLPGNKWGFNLYTQLSYGRGLQLSYGALKTAIGETLYTLKEFGLKNLALPRIGAGLAGGDWNKIAAILEEESNTHGIDITIYSL